MYADTARIRALADRLRERADDLRSLADRLLDRAAEVPWEGLAADAMRHHAGDRATALRRTARLHEDAAEALDRHAGRVGWVAEQLDAAGDAVEGAVEDGVRGLVGALPGIG